MRKNSVVVGVDGSRRSDVAVVWAADEAAVRGARLLVVHAVDTTGTGLWGTTRSLRDGLREMQRPVVDRAASIARRRQPALTVDVRVLIGSPTRLLLTMSDHVELIVVGRDGRGALERMWLGSLSERLLAHARCPVVAAGDWSPAEGEPHIERVVVACGGDETDESTLAWAFDVAERHAVPLVAVHGVRQPAGLVLPAAHSPTYAEAVIEADTYLSKQLVHWTHRYPDVHATRIARTGKAGDVVPAACKPGDLLVVGHHQRVPFAYHPLGPHATAIVRAARCAVVVVHTGGGYDGVDG